MAEADLYARLFRRVLQPGYETLLRRRPTLSRLAHLEKTQLRPLDEICAQQVADLRRLLSHAHRHVPYYRRVLDEAGVAPERVRSLDDLWRVPILRREQARAAGEERASTAPPFAVVRKGTSGSSGVPLTFGYDLESEYWRQAIKLRGYSWAGYQLGDRALHYWGAPVKPAPWRTRTKANLDHLIKRENYLDCTRRAEGDLEKVVTEIRRRRPTALVCYTQAGADLARFIVERGLRDWDELPVLCCAERLLPDDRERFEAAFGAVFETYGCREVMLIGAECEAHEGLHLSSENLIVEVVVTDGNRTRPARPGESGEVVITDLHNLGMPFIRYANGDLAVAGPEGACACGRSLPRLASVDGRVTDTLKDARGERVSGLLFNVMFAALAGTVRRFQAVQHPDRSVTLKLVPTEKLDDSALATIRDNFARHLPGLPLRTELVDDIPLSPSGKRKVVVVES
ncbi:MAG TPA: phenylacetate--CoA ligase family protein [Polyangia bacterium]